METLSFSAGMAIFLVLCLALLGLWAVLASGPSREWIRRMQRMEDGRKRQEAEFIANNCFREWRK